MQVWMIKRSVHSSWLVAVASGAVVVGVIASGWGMLLGSFVWCLLSLALFAMALLRRAAYCVPIIIIAGLLFGLWRGSVDQRELTAYKPLHGRVVELQATVVDDVDVGKRGEIILRLGSVVVGGKQLHGKVWMSTSAKVEIKRGDTVAVEGSLQPGFGSFSGVMYRATVVSIQRPEPGDVARRVRDWFADKIRLAIDDPQAALGIGYLVGQRRALPPDLDEALQIAGLTHIVVASGYNLTILVRLARRLFVRVSKYLSALSASVMILSFVAITGASPSMSRAGLVSGLSLAAWYYGRQFHPLVLLPFAAAVTVVINPSYAWNDLGWQLSFAAFAGVMIVAPLLQRYFYGQSKPGVLRQIVGETISAHIVTLPILIVAFGQMSNVAIIANMLVLPLVPLAMLLTFIAGMVAVAVPVAAPLVGIPAELVLGYMVYVVYFIADVPWALTEVQVPWWGGFIMYGVILWGVWWMWRKTKYNLRESNIIE